MNIKELKEFFKNDRFFDIANIEFLAVEENSSTVGARITPELKNAHGSVHGGVLFTLADAAFATLSAHLHPYTVTQSAQINYVSPAYTDYITATASELVRNGRNCICQVIIKDAKDNIVCTATLNGFIKENK